MTSYTRTFIVYGITFFLYSILQSASPFANLADAHKNYLCNFWHSAISLPSNFYMSTYRENSPINSAKKCRVRILDAYPTETTLYILYSQNTQYQTSDSEDIYQDICIYDAYNRKLIQNFSLSCQSIPSNQTEQRSPFRLGGAFSENGEFLTIGPNKLTPDLEGFYVYKRDTNTSGTIHYTLHTMLSLKCLQSIEPSELYCDRFFYNPNTDIITCLGPLAEIREKRVIIPRITLQCKTSNITTSHKKVDLINRPTFATSCSQNRRIILLQKNCGAVVVIDMLTQKQKEFNHQSPEGISDCHVDGTGKNLFLIQNRHNNHNALFTLHSFLNPGTSIATFTGFPTIECNGDPVIFYPYIIHSQVNCDNSNIDYISCIFRIDRSLESSTYTEDNFVRVANPCPSHSPMQRPLNALGKNSIRRITAKTNIIPSTMTKKIPSSIFSKKLYFIVGLGITTALGIYALICHTSLFTTQSSSYKGSYTSSHT